MFKIKKSKAEQQFAATQKREKLAETIKNKEQQERTDHMANLKALRLAKEAEDKKAAEKIAAEKEVAKVKKSTRLPQAHQPR